MYDDSPCTAEVPSKRQQPKRPETTARAPQKRPASDSSPNDRKRQPVHRRTAPRARSNPHKKKQVVFTKNAKTCTYNAPQKFKKGNLVDKVVLLLTGAFFPRAASETDPPDQQQPGRNQHGWF